MAEQIVAVRAGFWRRGIALVIDFVIIAVLLHVVAVIAYPLSKGRVQYGGVINIHTCVGITTLPPGMAAPPFQPNYGSRCQSYFVAWPQADIVTIGRRTQEGMTRTDIKIAVAVDENGHAISAFSLDWLLLPMFLLFRWWRDCNGAALGRLATSIHIDAPAQRTGPISKRYAWFSLLILPVYVLNAIWTIFGDLANVQRDLIIAGIVSIIEAIVLLILVVVPACRKRDSFYDRWAGTSVVLDHQPAPDHVATAPPSQ